METNSVDFARAVPSEASKASEAKAIPERRGDYDTGRTKDSLVFRADGARAAMFVNEVGSIGCAVDLPLRGSGSVSFSIEPSELIDWLRTRAIRKA